MEINAKIQFFNEIKTEDIHQTIIKSAADLISKEVPDYQFLAARLTIFHLRKKAFRQFEPPPLLQHIKKMVDLGLYDSSIFDSYDESEIVEFNSYIDHNRDYEY